MMTSLWIILLILFSLNLTAAASEFSSEQSNASTTVTTVTTNNTTPPKRTTPLLSSELFRLNKTTNGFVPMRKTTPVTTRPNATPVTTRPNATLSNVRTTGNAVRRTPATTTKSTTKGTKYTADQLPTGATSTATSMATECGVSEFAPLPCLRISGGMEAAPHSWPWQVNFKYSDCSWCTWCGGSLINSEWVLSAAHCFDAYIKTDFRVVLGDHSSQMDEGTEAEVTLRQVIAHEGYDPITHDNDIALVRLSAPVNWTAYVRPVCLPLTDVRTDHLCVATGWGQTSEGGNLSLVLNQVCVPIVNQTKCNGVDWYDGRVTPNMVCAGYPEGGRDTCKGDSGGPLVCSVDHRWYLNGVTRWGEGCTGSNRPGVYTRVWKYLDWIHATMHRRTMVIQLRLVNSVGGNATQDVTEGRLEVFYNGTWGSVCDDGFNDAAAAVACQSLGLGRNGVFLGNLYGPGSGIIWLDNVNCIGTEDSLDDCSHSNWGSTDCSHSEDVSIACTSSTTTSAAATTTTVATVNQFSLRLVNPKSASDPPSEGRLEIFYNETWGTICDDHFTDAAASVACQSLGFQRLGQFFQNYFGPGSGNIWLDDVICNGSERTIVDCRHSEWNASDCDHYEDVSIRCMSSSTSYGTPAAEFFAESTTGPGVECGVPLFVPRPCPRVVGGVEAVPHSWPWQVAMLYSGCDWCNFCGASVIYSDWIITAAHCLHRRSISDIRLILGEHSLPENEGTEEEVGIRRMIIHEDYDELTNDNDIALIRLTKSVEYNGYIRPVCLPTNDVPSTGACFTTGWGQTFGTGDSTRLNQVCVPILSDDQCNRTIWSTGGRPSSNVFCAGYPEGGMDSCQGDSGGPLVCYTNGSWVLYGVTSWGEICGEPNAPGVYTQVARYVDWIQKTISKYGNG